VLARPTSQVAERGQQPGAEPNLLGELVTARYSAKDAMEIIIAKLTVIFLKRNWHLGSSRMTAATQGLVTAAQGST